MHNDYDSDDSHHLGSGKRYNVDHKDHFEHRRSHSSEPMLNSPNNTRKESGLIPPTWHKFFVNPPIASQTSHGGQGQSPPKNTQPP